MTLSQARRELNKLIEEGKTGRYVELENAFSKDNAAMDCLARYCIHVYKARLPKYETSIYSLAGLPLVMDYYFKLFNGQPWELLHHSKEWLSKLEMIDYDYYEFVMGYYTMLQAKCNEPERKIDL